ncbi:MAG: glucose-1-phosphate adenylyltransferase subunit GlgD [Eggerthellaceae bacterium]|nr:glucose-1-phosphate adenylyltransferase subunit GlgD [Eggerthellaceae bacterium]
MTNMNDTFALVFAGHGNPLLGDLIAHRAVSALPLAGRYRTIDVVLSNIAQSGIRNVGVIMQRNFQSLVEHIGSGDAWDLNSKRGGVALLTPFDQGLGTGLYKGFGDALFAKRYYIDEQHAKYCFLLASDMVYREDYSRMLEHHIESGADITVLYSHDIRLGEGDPTLIANLDIKDGWVTGGEFGPLGAGGGCYNLGASVMDKELLNKLVEEACAEGRYDFVTDIIEPALGQYKVAAVEHTGYAARLTTVKSYFDMTRDMLDPKVRDDLFFEQGPVYTRVMDAPPIRYAMGCEVVNSVFGNGCDVCGRVEGSVVFRGVKIAEGADVKDCVIMQDSQIGKGAYLRNVIIDKDVVVADGARVIGTPDNPQVIRKFQRVG